MTDIYEYDGDELETRKLLRRGTIARIFRGGYVYTPVTAEKVLALIKAKKPEWVISGQSAVQLELGQMPTLPIQAITARNRRNISNAYVNVVRSRTRWRRKTKNGYCVPILHAITQVERKDAISFLRKKFMGGVVVLDREFEELRPIPRAAWEIVQAAGLMADSVPEQTLIEALCDRGYLLESNATLWGYRWDVVIRKYKLLIEVDGYAYHNGENRDVFIRDRWKQNTAILDGWKVLRFSAVCIEHDLKEVLEAVDIACGRKLSNSFAESAVWNWHHHFASWPEYFRSDFT